MHVSCSRSCLHATPSTTPITYLPVRIDRTLSNCDKQTHRLALLTSNVNCTCELKLNRTNLHRFTSTPHSLTTNAQIYESSMMYEREKTKVACINKLKTHVLNCFNCCSRILIEWKYAMCFVSILEGLCLVFRCFWFSKKSHSVWHQL